MQGCVLVVEDDPIIRIDTVLMLEDAGIPAVEFESADEALAYAQSHRREIAAIFTDVNLRGCLDGIELASIVSEADPRITLLVTSGGYSVRPARLPAQAQFIKKPWVPRQLLRVIQTAVGQASDA